MDVYIYAADIYCEKCGKSIRRRIRKEGNAPKHYLDETTYDSGEFPKGPIADGGGEADHPNHCASGEDCLEPTEIEGEKYGCFLENDLTTEGIDYINQGLRENFETGKDGAVVKFWANHYRSVGYDICDPEQEALDKEEAGLDAE